MNVNDFIKCPNPCFDVRSPKEYNHAHIPGAISLPLFSDSERALVGTAYKQQGKQIAIRLGIKLVGPKLDALLAEAEKHTQGTARVYCWRGGMRSGFVQQLLQLAGIATTQLHGGYKAYRRYAQDLIKRQQYSLKVLGGYTGSGKTEYLHTIDGQKIDLEALAHHRGSVYGSTGSQPSNEQFENEIAHALSQCSQSEPIWVEDESRLIGHCQIPSPFYEAMKRSPLYLLDVPKEERIRRIVEEYSHVPRQVLIAATQKLAKRLQVKPIVTAIEEGRAHDVVAMLLAYYDKAYDYALCKHQGPIRNWALLSSCEQLEVGLKKYIDI